MLGDELFENSSDQAQESLFDTISRPGNAIKMTIDDWFDAYEVSKGDATSELIHLIVHASGCVEEIDVNEEIATTLGELQANYKPQKQAKKDVVKQQKLLNLFWSKWLVKAKSSVLFDESEVIDTVINWLVTMSSSAFRPIRATSTLTVFSIITTLCEITASIQTDLQDANRQLDTQRARKAQLTTQIATMSAKVTKLESLMEDLFNGVFVHRYRDSDTAIRQESVAALGVWISTYPDTYLNTEYLRYIGSMLSDKVAAVRSEAIKALSALYSNPSMLRGLRELTERFKPRFIQMAFRELDTSLKLLSAGLLASIYSAELFSEDDEREMMLLLFVGDAKIGGLVAEACVGIIRESYEDEGQVSEDEKIYSFAQFIISGLKRARVKEQEAIDETKINDMDIDTSGEDADEPIIAYFKQSCRSIDSTFDFMAPPIIKHVCNVLSPHMDDISLSSFLSTDFSTDEEITPEIESFLCLYLLGVCDHVDSETVVKHIPLLLQKYAMHFDEKSTFCFDLLVQCLSKVDVNILLESEQELDDLLTLLERSFNRHTNQEVLLRLCSFFGSLCNDTAQPRSREVLDRMSACLDELVNAATTSLATYRSETVLASEADHISLTHSFLRVNALSSLIAFEDCEALFQVSNAAIDYAVGCEQSDSIFQSCLEIMNTCIFVLVSAHSTDNDNMQSVKEKSLRVYKIVQVILCSDFSVGIQLHSLRVLTDLWLVMNSPGYKDECGITVDSIVEGKICELVDRVLKTGTLKRNEPIWESVNVLMVDIGKLCIRECLGEETLACLAGWCDEIGEVCKFVFGHMWQIGGDRERFVEETLRVMFAMLKTVSIKNNGEYVTFIEIVVEAIEEWELVGSEVVLAANAIAISFEKTACDCAIDACMARSDDGEPVEVKGLPMLASIAGLLQRMTGKTQDNTIDKCSDIFELHGADLASKEWLVLKAALETGSKPGDKKTGKSMIVSKTKGGQKKTSKPRQKKAPSAEKLQEVPMQRRASSRVEAISYLGLMSSDDEPDQEEDYRQPKRQESASPEPVSRKKIRL